MPVSPRPNLPVSGMTSVPVSGVLRSSPRGMRPRKKVAGGGVVIPDPVPVFNFNNISNALLSTQLTATAVVTGLTAGPMTATLGSVSGSTAEIKSTTDNVYNSTSVIVNEGDTITVRMTSPSGNSQSKSIIVSVGSTSDTWTINTTPIPTATMNFSDPPLQMAGYVYSQSNVQLSPSDAIGVASANFGAQVSLNNSTWSSSVNITHNQTLYVRYNAGAWANVDITVTVGSSTNDFHVETANNASFSFTGQDVTVQPGELAAGGSAVSSAQLAGTVQSSNGAIQVSVNLSTWGSSVTFDPNAGHTSIYWKGNASNSYAGIVQSTITYQGGSALAKITTATQPKIRGTNTWVSATESGSGVARQANGLMSAINVAGYAEVVGATVNTGSLPPGFYAELSSDNTASYSTSVPLVNGNQMYIRALSPVTSGQTITITVAIYGGSTNPTYWTWQITKI